MLKDKKPLTAVAYEYVYTNIINGVYSVNDIVSEGSLIQQLGISKTPVREALVALCTEGILQSIPRMGYQVIQIMPSEACQMYQARLLLESTLLKKTIEIITEEQIAQLEAYCERAKKDYLVRNSAMECWERNSGFHLLLASFSGNQYLYRMLKQVFRDCARAMTQYFLLKAQGKVDDEQNQYHDRVIRALREKDLACAQELIKKDVYLSLDETMLKRAE